MQRRGWSGKKGEAIREFAIAVPCTWLPDRFDRSLGRLFLSLLLALPLALRNVRACPVQHRRCSTFHDSCGKSSEQGQAYVSHCIPQVNYASALCVIRRTNLPPRRTVGPVSPVCYEPFRASVQPGTEISVLAVRSKIYTTGYSWTCISFQELRAAVRCILIQVPTANVQRITRPRYRSRPAQRASAATGIRYRACSFCTCPPPPGPQDTTVRR